MFRGASSFNQPLIGWRDKLMKDTILTSMFDGTATSFNMNGLTEVKHNLEEKVKEKEKEKAIDNVNDKVTFRMYIRTLDGDEMCLEDIKPSDLIINIKQKIAEKEGTRTDACGLIYRGKVLEDYMLVSDYEITADSTVKLLVKQSTGLKGNSKGLDKLLLYEYGREWLFE
jgi:hypothetical protein